MIAGAADHAAAGDGRSGGLTVLIVHPDDATRAQLTRRMGSTVDRLLEAPSCEQALYLVSTRAVDLVVTGLDLPGMDGEDLLHELRGRGGPPVVALLDPAASTRRAAWLDAGGADCIDRHDDPAATRARFAAVLRRAGFGQAARRPRP